MSFSSLFLHSPSSLSVFSNHALVAFLLRDNKRKGESNCSLLSDDAVDVTVHLATVLVLLGVIAIAAVEVILIAASV